MTTISDSQAERCLEKWLQYMVEIGSTHYETVRSLKNEKAFRVTINDETEQFQKRKEEEKRIWIETLKQRKF